MDKWSYSLGKKWKEGRKVDTQGLLTARHNASRFLYVSSLGATPNTKIFIISPLFFLQVRHLHLRKVK